MQNKKKNLPNIYNLLLPKQTKNLSRFGRNKDGGYVVDSTVMESINHLISFGMGDEFTFEQEFLKTNEKNIVEIYDHTVGHWLFLWPIIKCFKRFITFRRKFSDLVLLIKNYYNFLVFINNNRTKFKKNKITEKINTKNEKTVYDILPKIKNATIGLKIDIEGDEYKILEQVNKNQNIISILIIEFHNIDIKKESFFSTISILSEHFNIIHLHGNNHDKTLPDGFPNVIEITFLNKKNKILCETSIKSFPLKNLDFPNNPHLSDIEFQFE